LFLLLRLILKAFISNSLEDKLKFIKIKNKKEKKK
jgi:hypothetical protein